ncbi:DUF928 domain-containing protein [Nostoc sp.]|uniref:DUF928 domain-containing protein n=1 Tax=Nostoc sp. TaxID=1180 RepID=UPI002FF6A8C9
MPSYEQRLKQGAGETTITQVLGLTSVEQPSFWFYVPYKQSSIQAIEFVLQTEQNKTIHRANISVPPIPGIVRLQLQNTTTLLETNKLYHWFFKVTTTCKSNQSVALNFVEGWVQRVNLDIALREQFKQLSPQQQAAIYAKNGIWYDALTTLAEFHLKGSQDSGLTEDWKNLLKVIQLEEMAIEPLL